MMSHGAAGMSGIDGRRYWERTSLRGEDRSGPRNGVNKGGRLSRGDRGGRKDRRMCERNRC
jgi:hypothetical protein